MSQTIKLWVGMGAYILAGTCAVASPSHATEPLSSTTSSEEMTQFIVQGGEGGEVTSNADYMTNIRLMKGHLIAGLELYMRGENQMAQTHLEHPAKEILTSLAPSLEEKGLYRPVDTSLTRLSELAASGASQREIKKAYEEAMGVLTAAENVVPASERQSPEFLGNVISTLISTAVAEYEIALQGNTFTDIPEYQDGRGFVATARELLYNNAEEMVKMNPEAYTQLSTMVGQVSAAWPTVMPPSQPVYSAQEVMEMAEEIEKITE